MIRVRFKCTFLSDIILNSHTATEGHAQSLDYVPGANFLGIVAKKYKSFGEQTFTVFHSGEVRFGDAHPAYNDLRSLQMPLSWFQPKEKNSEKEENSTSSKEKNSILKIENIFLHHSKKRKELSKNGTQLKQIRTGFFTENGVEIKPEHSFSIKSAYDLKNRRSEDEKMYGYDALSHGSEWIFSVDFDDEKLVDQVIQNLEGEKNLGRSRSSQYGKVCIKKISNASYETPTITPCTGELLFIYAESLLAFFDEHGQPTFEPSLKDLGFDSTEEIKIQWEYSQIRTKVFAPWNGVRKSRDADRVCIDKGSVFVLKVSKNFDVSAYANKLQKGIGAYRSEGMGQIIINPNFLEPDENGHPKIKMSENVIQPTYEYYGIQEKDSSDDLIWQWIEHKHKKNENKSAILKAVNNFLTNATDFKNITPSQWGAIRAIAQSNDYKNMHRILFGKQPEEKITIYKEQAEEPEGFLLKGKSEKMWKTTHKKLKTEIETMMKVKGEDCAKIYTINLCSEMAKWASAERKKNESKVLF